MDRDDSGAVRVGDDGTVRCRWGAGPDPLYMKYHDTEWGRPVVDDRRLFEKICLEGFQSGLSWLTILRKRENFRTAFAGFDPERVACFGPRDVERLLGDTGIVRHRGKIESTINNAARMLDLVEQHGSLAAWVWSREPAAPYRPDGDPCSIPAASPASTAMSKELKQRGWSFVGPTTVYSFMQAMGLTNDHDPRCHAWALCDRERSTLRRPR